MEKIPKYSEFRHWFELCSNNTDVRVTCIADPEESQQLIYPLMDFLCDQIRSDILPDKGMFENRPEYALFRVSQIIKENNPKTAYLTLLRACLYVRLFKFNTTWEDEAELVYARTSGWLTSTDFFSSPASTVYHDAVEGGLVQHSLRVAELSAQLAQSRLFPNIDLQSALLCALLHDWCKIGSYIPYLKNVKDDVTGQWTKVAAYKWNDEIKVPLGHGEASMWMASKFVRLSLEESCAIRYHMGKWRIAEADVNALQYANELYPLVHLIQFADQLSITKYRVTSC